MSISNKNFRPITNKDLPLLLTWRNHPDIRKFMYTQHEITLSEHQNWFDKVSRDPTRQLLLYYDYYNPVGFCQFTINKHRAEWGFYLSPEATTGAGTRLGKAALNYAFDELQLHKVSGEALDFNLPSVKFHRKLGFVDEGCLRDHAEIDGKYYDIYCFGLLKTEWHSKREKL